MPAHLAYQDKGHADLGVPGGQLFSFGSAFAHSALCWPLVAIVALTVSRRCAAADASLFFDAELLSAEEGPQVIWATPGGGVELPI